jgi:hypothetical protein
MTKVKQIGSGQTLEELIGGRGTLRISKNGYTYILVACDKRSQKSDEKSDLYSVPQPNFMGYQDMALIACEKI